MSASTTYSEYLESEAWQTVLTAARIHSGGRCLACNDTKDLHGHHRTYERLYNEAPGDVVMFCESCHNNIHTNVKLTRAVVTAQKLTKQEKKSLKKNLSAKKSSSPSEINLPYPDEIEMGKSIAGGYTRAQLSKWGVPWPPPKGWKADIERRRIELEEKRMG